MMVRRLPKVDWPIVPLSHLAVVQTGVAKGGTTVRDPIELPYLRVANVQAGSLDLREVKTITIDRRDVARFSLQTGDVLMTEGGDFDKLGRGTIWRGELDPCLHQNHVFAVRCNRAKLLPEWLSYVAGSPYGRRYFTLCSKQSTNLASINSTQLKAFPIPLPSLAEQRNGSELLGAIEGHVTTTSRLVRAKRGLRRGLASQLLTGRRRFPEYRHADWRTLTLGELLRYVPRKVPKPVGTFLSAGVRSHGKGVFLKTEFHADAIALDELFELKHRDLVVNITFGWEGAIAIVPPEADGALVSHRFPTYEVDENRVLVEYLRHLIRLRRFVFDVGRASPGGAGRNRVLNRAEFLKITLRIPPIDEQRRIAETLNACDSEIELLERERECLETLSRGLLSRLLSGEIAVPA